MKFGRRRETHTQVVPASDGRTGHVCSGYEHAKPVRPL